MSVSRKSFLALLISSVTYSSAIAQSDSGSDDIDRIVVRGERPDQPTLYLHLPPIDGGYRWWDTQQGNSNGGSSSGISESGGQNWNPACIKLAMGKPEGCTRSLANAGLPEPELLSPWQLIHLRAEISALESMAGYIDQALSMCYADVSRDPSECESNYYDSWEYWLNVYAPNRPLSQGGLDSLESSHSVAQAERALLEWTHAWVGGVSLYFVSLNTPTTGLHGNNKSLAAAREQRNCEQFIDAWDAHQCSSA